MKNRILLVAIGLGLLVAGDPKASAQNVTHRLTVAQAGSGFNTSEQYPIDHSNGPSQLGSRNGGGGGAGDYDGTLSGTCWDINDAGDCTYGKTIGFPDKCVTRPSCRTK